MMFWMDCRLSQLLSSCVGIRVLFGNSTNHIPPRELLEESSEMTLRINFTAIAANPQLNLMLKVSSEDVILPQMTFFHQLITSISKAESGRPNPLTVKTKKKPVNHAPLTNLPLYFRRDFGNTYYSYMILKNSNMGTRVHSKLGDLLLHFPNSSQPLTEMDSFHIYFLFPSLKLDRFHSIRKGSKRERKLESKNLNQVL